MTCPEELRGKSSRVTVREFIPHLQEAWHLKTETRRERRKLAASKCVKTP